MDPKKEFSPMQIDAIGEILNISLGASATAVSTMLNTRVDITTPKVRLVTADEFNFTNIQPAIGVEITYVDGLEGKNIMLLKRNDVKVIVELLMGMEIPEEEFELDEMNLSAICEVMNQMMGASSTALSEFLGRTVNISTPVSFEVEEAVFKSKYFTDDAEMVVVDFLLKIDNKLESEFLNVMSYALAKELLSVVLPDEPEMEQPIAVQPTPAPSAPAASGPGEMMSEDAIAQLLAASAAAAPPQTPQMNTAAAPSPMPAQQPMPGMMPAQQPMMGNQQDLLYQQQMMQQQMQQQQLLMQQMQQQLQMFQNAPPAKADNKTINAQPIRYAGLNGYEGIGDEQEENLDLILGVSLDVSVEIGRTHSAVKDILEYTKGTLVVLDKLAGDPVDLFVNGRCIAKGEVVVVDDNFGIRISEIMRRPDIE